MSQYIYLIECLSGQGWYEWSKFSDRDTAWKKYTDLYASTYYSKIRMKLIGVEIIMEEDCPFYKETVK